MGITVFEGKLDDPCHDYRIRLKPAHLASETGRYVLQRHDGDRFQDVVNVTPREQALIDALGRAGRRGHVLIREAAAFARRHSTHLPVSLPRRLDRIADGVETGRIPVPTHLPEFAGLAAVREWARDEGLLDVPDSWFDVAEIRRGIGARR